MVIFGGVTAIDLVKEGGADLFLKVGEDWTEAEERCNPGFFTVLAFNCLSLLFSLVCNTINLE